MIQEQCPCCGRFDITLVRGNVLEAHIPANGNAAAKPFKLDLAKIKAQVVTDRKEAAKAKKPAKKKGRKS